MRGWLRPLLAAGWSLLALALLVAWLTHDDHATGLAVLGALAGAALALLAWRRPATWGGGAAALAALAVAPVLYAAWWAQPMVLVLAALPAALLALEPGARAPALPPRALHAAAAMGLAYLLLAPPGEAQLMGPPEPPGASLGAGIAAGPERAVALAGGAGAARLQAARPSEGGMAVDVVRLVLPAGEALPHAVRATFAPGPERTLPLLPFPVWLWTERHVAPQALPGGWQRLVVREVEGALFVLLPVPLENGTRQVFLLRQIAETPRLSLLPPFVGAWEVWGGFRLAEEGNATETLRRLDGNVSIGGALLALPPEAYEDTRAGRFHTPWPAVPGALAALGLAALAARSRKR